MLFSVIWKRKEKEGRLTGCFLACSSLVYVEADTSLRQYEDAEGRKNTQLSLVQREYPSRHTMQIQPQEENQKRKLTN